MKDLSLVGPGKLFALTNCCQEVSRGAWQKPRFEPGSCKLATAGSRGGGGGHWQQGPEVPLR